MTRGPTPRTGTRPRTGASYPHLVRRLSASTLLLTGLIYVAWGTVSAVIVVVIGLFLAAAVSQVSTLDRSYVAAVIITALTAVAGSTAPMAVPRLQTSLGRAKTARREREHNGPPQP